MCGRANECRGSRTLVLNIRIHAGGKEAVDSAQVVCRRSREKRVIVEVITAQFQEALCRFRRRPIAACLRTTGERQHHHDKRQARARIETFWSALTCQRFGPWTLDATMFRA